MSLQEQQRPVTADLRTSVEDSASATRRLPMPWFLRATTLAGILAIVRIALVLSLPYDKLVGLFDDDAFYYFGVAHNIAAGHGSTFNGLDPTNGYHPLWLGLLVPVFALTGGRAASWP